MRTAYSDVEIQAMMTDVESDLVERKETFDGDAPRTVREAICAFANDLPDRRRPGVVFVGVRDDGTPAGLEINDALLLKLAHCKTDGNILPPPSMTVGKHVLGGKDVAVVTVAPADSPPVRFRGRIWTRVGPRRALASAQDERMLNEKRRHGDAPFDTRPVRGATLADLDLPRFQYLYLPRAFDAEVLARNDRTVEERLAATKMIASVTDPTPTVLGVLMLARCAWPSRDTGCRTDGAADRSRGRWPSHGWRATRRSPIRAVADRTDSPGRFPALFVRERLQLQRGSAAAGPSSTARRRRPGERPRPGRRAARRCTR